MPAGNPGPVSQDRYVAALGGDDPVDSMREAPRRLRRLCRGLSEAELSRPAARGKWSIKQIVAHLADGDAMLGARYRMVASLDRPVLVGYDQDAFAERLGIEKVTTAELLADFENVRSANVHLLERIPAEAWHRVGMHTERGEEALLTMVRMYAGHDRIHEAQVETIRLALFPPAETSRRSRPGTGRALVAAVATRAKRKLAAKGARLALRGAAALARSAGRSGASGAVRRLAAAGKESLQMAAKKAVRKSAKVLGKAAAELTSKRTRKKAAKAGETALSMATGLAAVGARAARRKIREISRKPATKALVARARALAGEGLLAVKKEGKILSKLAQKKAGVLRKAAGKKGTELRKAAGKKGTELRKAAGEKGTELRKAAGEKSTELREAAGKKGTELRKAAGKKGTELRKAAGRKGTELRKVAGRKGTELRKAAEKKGTELRKGAASAWKKAKKSAKKLSKRALTAAEKMVERADETRRELVDHIS